MKTKCHRIVSEDSQNLQRYIHIIISLIYSLSTLLTLRPKGKIGNFYIFCLFDCKIITECTIFKCKVSFLFNINNFLSKKYSF